MSYFDWLCMIDIPDGYRRSDYSMLLNLLMNTEFHWVVPRDENRAKDGLELRDIYEQETGEWCDAYGSCSVLEMLTALAIRCNDEIMYNPDDPKRADIWFWMFIENLGLAVFKNENSHPQPQTAILRILNSHKMFSFPEQPPNFDKMELWCQLNHYLMWRFEDNFT